MARQPASVAQPAPTSVAPDRDGALSDALEALQRMQAAARRLRGREARGGGRASYAHLIILHVLSSGELTGGQLASLAQLTPATVTQMLDALETEGLVERRRSESDRRVVYNRLTARGRSIQRERQRLADKAFAEVFSDLSVTEIEVGIRTLERVQRFYEALGKA